MVDAYIGRNSPIYGTACKAYNKTAWTVAHQSPSASITIKIKKSTYFGETLSPTGTKTQALFCPKRLNNFPTLPVVFVCLLARTNRLLYLQASQGYFPHPGAAITYACVENTRFTGECIMGQVNSSGLGITIHNTCHPRHKRAMGLLLAEAGEAILMAASWGGFLYYKTTLGNLTQVFDDLTSNMREALQGFQTFLDSMANVLDNRLVLDYLLLSTLTESSR